MAMPCAFRRVAGIALASTLGLVAGACSDDDGGRPDVGAFEQAMVDEYGASSEEAACIAGYVLDEYPADDVRTIQADGIDALPLTRWEPYLATVFACLNQDSTPPR